MAKETGLGARFYIDEYNISADVQQLDGASKSIAVIDMTDITLSAYERQAGIAEANLSATLLWNPARAHLALRTLPRADRIVTYTHRNTRGTPAASINGKQVSYNGTRENSGKYTAKVEAQANAYWLDWGKLVTDGLQTDTAATNSTAVDFTAGYAFGLQAYLHVIAFTGTSATITLEASSDNGVGDAFTAITGGAFSTVTGATKERIATARDTAVERYVRVATTGVFSDLQFVVNVAVNRVETLL